MPADRSRQLPRPPFRLSLRRRRRPQTPGAVCIGRRHSAPVWRRDEPFKPTWSATRPATAKNSSEPRPEGCAEATSGRGQRKFSCGQRGALHRRTPSGWNSRLASAAAASPGAQTGSVWGGISRPIASNSSAFHPGTKARNDAVTAEHKGKLGKMPDDKNRVQQANIRDDRAQLQRRESAPMLPTR